MRLDPNDAQHLQLRDQWFDAGRKFNAQADWKKENKNKFDDHETWLEAWHKARKTIGLPEDVLAPGQIEWNGFHGFLTLKLRKPIRDDDDNVVVGRVNQCRQCKEVYLTGNALEPFCSETCQKDHSDGTKDQRTSRQKEARSRLSEALSSRQGVCLCCGATFTLKRTTAKTCSDKCRTSLRRKGQAVKIDKIAAMPEEAYQQLVDKHESLRGNLRDAIISAFSGTPQPEGTTDGIKTKLDQTKQLLNEQNSIRAWNTTVDKAPALAAWLSQQPKDDQLALMNLDQVTDLHRTTLGPDLIKALRVSQ